MFRASPAALGALAIEPFATSTSRRKLIGSITILPALLLQSLR
jgi:hypothetical protein